MTQQLHVHDPLAKPGGDRLAEVERKVESLIKWQNFCFGVSAAVGAIVGFAFAFLSTGLVRLWK